MPVLRNPRIIPLAQVLRRDAAPAERKLWQAVRHGALGGAKVRRQVPFEAIVVDFVFPAQRLVVELDGCSHDSAEGVSADSRRDAWLAAQGFRVLRFANRDVLGNLEGVVTAISVALRHPHPGPPPQAGEGEGSLFTAPSPACGGGPGWGCSHGSENT